MSDEFDEESTSIEMQGPVRKVVASERHRRLILIEGPAFGDSGVRQIILGDAPLTLGRSRRADVRVDALSLSRLHIRLAPRGHEYEVTDLDSRNGLFINGIRARSALLREGDIIQIGDVILEYRE